MLAHVRSYDHQILKPSGAGDDKAVLAACVLEIRAGSRESSTARVRVLVAVVRARWCARFSLEAGFMGFGRDMP